MLAYADVYINIYKVLAFLAQMAGEQAQHASSLAFFRALIADSGTGALLVQKYLLSWYKSTVLGLGGRAGAACPRLVCVC